MNRYVAGDLSGRQGLSDSNNVFHSQGSIIGTGAMNILNSKTFSNQSFIAVGPAVSESNWNSSVGTTGGNPIYVHTSGDYIRYLATPDYLRGLRGIPPVAEGINDGHGFSDNPNYWGQLRDGEKK